MNTYKNLFQTYLREKICSFRDEKQYTQEQMAELLHISPRAYIDQEHGVYGFSALCFVFFLLIIPEGEVLIFLNDFKALVKDMEEDNEVA